MVPVTTNQLKIQDTKKNMGSAAHHGLKTPEFLNSF